MRIRGNCWLRFRNCLEHKARPFGLDILPSWGAAVLRPYRRAEILSGVSA